MDAAMRTRRNRQFFSLFPLLLLFATVTAAGVAFAGLPGGSTGSTSSPARLFSGNPGAPAVQRPPVARPASTITWQPATNNFGEPDSDDIAVAVHPTDPLRALVGGPRPTHLLYTTDGGTTWQGAAGLEGVYGGVPAWVPGGNGQSAVYVSLTQLSLQANLTPGPTGNALNFARTTDSGIHWSTPTTMTIPGVAENMPYLWADANPSSPYYGRMYLTVTMLGLCPDGELRHGRFALLERPGYDLEHAPRACEPHGVFRGDQLQRLRFDGDTAERRRGGGLAPGDVLRDNYRRAQQGDVVTLD